MTHPTLEDIRTTMAEQDAELASCAASVPQQARFDESILAAIDDAASVDDLPRRDVAALPAFLVRA